ncbi:MAG TPA: preprotein translocase subunit SecY [Patescibacteria group bacterium]|nr:preprotein translocase subunit SecY [Patescibacteria group bacterium]
MINSMRAAFALPDLRRRILFTIWILVVYRLVANIPVPGVDLESWLLYVESADTATGLIAVLNLLSGGAVSSFSVMAMGVYPYITASIIMQLLQPIIPQLEELASEGETGRNKINKITYYLTIPLAMLQAVGQIRLIGFGIPGGLETILPHFGLGAGDILPTMTTILAMTGGTMFAIWLGEQITEEGIGQGISLIIFGGIVSRIPANLIGLVSIPEISGRVFSILSFLIITVLTVLVIVIIQEGQRRIPVQYGRRVRGRKVYQGQSTHIPLKVNTAGMIPIIFAQSILTFPALIAQFFINNSGSFVDTSAQWISNQLGTQQTFLYWFIYFIFVVGFTFFYTDVMVQQQRLWETLQKQGGFIPGIRPGRKTQEYIMSVVRRITFVGAIFLGTIAILPGILQAVGRLLRIPGIERSALVITGAGLIIVVGVVIDTMRQLEAQLIMRHYESFI